MKNINKIKEIIKISLKTSLQYRTEMFLWLIIDTLPMIAMVVLWLAVYSQGQVISGYSLDQMLSYYVVGYFVNSLISVHIEEYWVEQIREGNISFVLLKPFPFKIFSILDEIAWKIMYTILALLPIMLIAVKTTSFFYLPTLTQALYLSVAFLLGFIIDALFSLLVIASAFIFDQAHSLAHLKWMLIWIFSGSMIPYELMPSWLSVLSKRLPFQHVFNTPLRIYLEPNNLNNYLLFLLNSIIWVLVLYLILKMFWKYAIKKYSAVGN